MKGQLNLFDDLPPPADKPLKFKPAERAIWTENKAKLIERYLFYFVLITKHGAYIDGFAGPQYLKRRDAWAAKMVLESKPPFLRNFWLCELNPKSVQMLRALKDAQPFIKNRAIEIVPGDFNANVASLLQTSGIDDSVATFCLLDQRTFECEWQTLVTLSKHRSDYKIELFYFLATGWLDRSMEGIKNKSILEKWWGRPDYAQLRGMNSFDRMNLFCTRISEELGYKHAYGWPIYSRERGGRVMYHMIHATDHDEAPKIMNRAYRNALRQREDLRLLQRDLSQLWGTANDIPGKEGM
ncbi:three-Cys-motif partner protein TcmP [Bradyrhizobium sp. ARR65]|uniref:three-Cys-motif partner protein TcmP n=1 Tax=Bradyrhizobium sp. ARR65 TaxID=1040989 RepID=UPI000467CB29|nr:three-Cys-motif partner protein TcmP [Bradyrhizobium sp. ARR65]